MSSPLSSPDLEPPPLEMQQLLGAICGNHIAMDDFVSVNAGTLSPDVFFSPEHIGRAFEHDSELVEVLWTHTP